MNLKEVALNISFAGGSFIIMLLPVVISIVFNIKIANEISYFSLSIYGIYIVFYMTIQIIFSYLNKRKVENIERNNPVITDKYNILIVGYREDPELFKKCLKSVQNLENQENIHKIFIVIDGNDEGDFYMAEIAKEFLKAMLIVVPGLVSENPEYFSHVHFTERIYCFLQPHKGKRHALYTGLKLSCEDEEVKGVLCTDSDTELDKKSFYYLANLLESKENYGAVTGNVEIINSNASIISFLSSLRYWFACNLERAYQSFNECVLCVSGPLGIYKTECLKIFLDNWLNQRFLSQECTYGDDRHLTNNILIMGKKVVYTHLAKCYTDAPETIKRFFNQQNRWCKSSFREFLWNVKSLYKHSLWMTIDLIYQTLYSFIVLGSLVYILIFGTLFQMLFYIITLIFFNLIKGIYACIISKSFKYLLFTFYGFVYISILAPAKLFASFTLRDVAWGTSSRVNIVNGFELKHIFLIFWNIIIISGVCYNLIKNLPYDTDEIITISTIFTYIIVIFILIVVVR